MNASETAPYGLPQHLTTTYDHFGFEKHRAVSYNAHIYLTALQAARQLAMVVGDAATLQAVEAALALSTQAIVDDRLWNASDRFFRCHTADGGEGDNQVITWLLQIFTCYHPHRYHGYYVTDIHGYALRADAPPPSFRREFLAAVLLPR